MTVAITQALNEARLAGVLAFLDAGAQRARLRIYAGTRPATPADAPAGTPLAEVPLAKPAGTVSGGVLALAPYDEGLIVATGVATWARVVNGADQVAFDLDCSDTGGGGDVILASTQLYAGGGVRPLSALIG